jgi:hypothetical protein
MKPSVISFNGLGKPRQPHVSSGHIAILVQGEKKEVVRIELLPAEEFGPRLDHAKNQEALIQEIEHYLSSLDVSELTTDRDWIIDCPTAVAAKAVFS